MIEIQLAVACQETYPTFIDNKNIERYRSLI